MNLKIEVDPYHLKIEPYVRKTDKEILFELYNTATDLEKVLCWRGHKVSRVWLELENVQEGHTHLNVGGLPPREDFK